MSYGEAVLFIKAGTFKRKTDGQSLAVLCAAMEGDLDSFQLGFIAKASRQSTLPIEDRKHLALLKRNHARLLKSNIKEHYCILSLARKIVIGLLGHQTKVD